MVATTSKKIGDRVVTMAAQCLLSPWSIIHSDSFTATLSREWLYDRVLVPGSRWDEPRIPTATLLVGIGAVRCRNPTTALRYSAAAGDATLGELAEWDSKFAEPFATGALISPSGLSERRDFPSK